MGSLTILASPVAKLIPFDRQSVSHIPSAIHHLSACSVLKGLRKDISAKHGDAYGHKKVMWW